MASPTKRNSSEEPKASETDDERFANEARDARGRRDRERASLEQAHDAAMLPIKEKLERALKLVRDSGVSDAVEDALSIMKHWPAWSKRPDWQAPVAVDQIDGGRIGEGYVNGYWIAWRWNDAAYRLRLDVQRTFLGEADNFFGDLKLWVADDLVLHLDVSQDMASETDQWHAFGLSAFRAGPWMAEINDLVGQLRIKVRQQSLDWDAERHAQKLRNINLD